MNLKSLLVSYYYYYHTITSIIQLNVTIEPCGTAQQLGKKAVGVFHFWTNVRHEPTIIESKIKSKWIFNIFSAFSVSTVYYYCSHIKYLSQNF